MRTIRRSTAQCPDGLPNNGFCVPPGSAAINNNSIAGRAINPVTYQGIRASCCTSSTRIGTCCWRRPTKTWIRSGVFYQQPNASDGAPLHPLEVTLFNAAYNKDKFEMTSWTIERQVRRR